MNLTLFLACSAQAWRGLDGAQQGLGWLPYQYHHFGMEEVVFLGLRSFH